jgi:3-hydroxybutyryl-CoA dehydrogenase
VRVETIAVVGSGRMGRGIAYAAAASGYRTIIHDLSAEALDRARKQIRADLDEGRARGKLTSGDADAAYERLQPETDLRRAVAEAGFVIEAVPEQIDLKLQVFARLDEACAEGVVLASNTSSLSVTEIAAATRRPQSVVGMHFFNPVPKMKLVEIVRGLESADDALRTTEQVARRMGKETVVVRESPGFITSRINAMIGNEAFFMFAEGVASARDIDKALKLGLNHPMGPFELVDLVGLDTRLSMLEFMHRTLGEKYRPAPLLVQHVRAGRVGKKVGRGVYDYARED